jgi:wyosine [tRNA(Phe)-imidazoG37] synthetase (radical SAM superfamily)
MALSTPLFTQHSREWRTNRYVYPVISRRAKGLSIGVNLNPDKACNFDCVYCSVDRTLPAKERDVDLDVLGAELGHLLDLAASGELFACGPLAETPPPLRRLNDVAFSGDGEPTSFPRFGDACRLAAGLIAARALACKVVTITNATLLDRPEVEAAFAFLDAHRGEVWAKLDAGTEDYYRRVERTKVPLARVAANLLACGRRRDLVIQSLFMRIDGEPASATEIAAYVERLRALKADGCRIRLVQVYTTARRTAESFVTPLTAAELEAIAVRVRELGIAAETYPGVSA